MVIESLDFPLLKKGLSLGNQVYNYFWYGLMFELPCPQYVLEINTKNIIKTWTLNLGNEYHNT
jgi:hypothetical protein